MPRGGLVWGKPGPVEEGEYPRNYFTARIEGRKLSERYLVLHHLLPLVSCVSEPDFFTGPFNYVETPELEALFEPAFLWVGDELFEAPMRYPLRGEWIQRMDKGLLRVLQGWRMDRVGEVIFNHYD